MKEILLALHDLGKALAINGYKSDFSLVLSNYDFHKFLQEIETFKFGYRKVYTKLSDDPLEKIVSDIKIAGPNCYFLIKRKND